MGTVTLIICGLALLSLVLSWLAHTRDTPLDWRFDPPAEVPATGAAVFETVLDHTPTSGQAHSPGIVVTEAGFDVLWFEGSKEAQSDVDIFGSAILRGPASWSAGLPERRISRTGLSQVFDPRQIVVTLGNTIENEAVPQGLFATVASVGGWAMASTVDVRTDAQGRLVSARKLNLSPFLNRSHLVKSPMVHFSDGSLGLPAYFELGATHGVLARFTASGRVRDVRRIAGDGKPIQPMIVPLDDKRAVAFLRDFDPSFKLMISHTEDGGQSWSWARHIDIANPSSPVAALGLGGSRILLAVNDLPDAPDVLRLVLSEDAGDSWRELRRFEADGALRYPMLRRLSSGEIALAYSKGTKQGVVAHVFNQAWVEAAA